MWKYPYKTKPYEHQRNALETSAEKTAVGLFYGNGYRKNKSNYR